MKEEENALFSVNESTFSGKKFSARRSHLEIRMDVLSSIKSGAEKPTQIMYRSNLSWTALKGHLVALEDAKLLRIVEYGNRRKYELTEKAISVMITYKGVLEQLSSRTERTAPSF